MDGAVLSFADIVLFCNHFYINIIILFENFIFKEEDQWWSFLLLNLDTVINTFNTLKLYEDCCPYLGTYSLEVLDVSVHQDSVHKKGLVYYSPTSLNWHPWDWATARSKKILDGRSHPWETPYVKKVLPAHSTYILLLWKVEKSLWIITMSFIRLNSLWKFWHAPDEATRKCLHLSCVGA